MPADGKFVPYAARGGSAYAISVCVGALTTFLCSGIIYGYQALLPVLYEHGAFSQLCAPGALDKAPLDGHASQQHDGPSNHQGPASRGVLGADVPADILGGDSHVMESQGATATLRDAPWGAAQCLAQSVRINALFTGSLSTLFLCVALFGYLTDKLGASLTLGIATLLSCTASVFVGLAATASDPERAAPLWTIGIILWGAASPGIFTPALSLPYLTDAPRISALVTTVVICLFDASSGVFFLWQLLLKNGSVHLSTLAFTYAVVCAVLGLPFAWTLPRAQSHDGGDAGGGGGGGTDGGEFGSRSLAGLSLAHDAPAEAQPLLPGDGVRSRSVGGSPAALSRARLASGQGMGFTPAVSSPSNFRSMPMSLLNIEERRRLQLAEAQYGSRRTGSTSSGGGGSAAAGADFDADGDKEATFGECLRDPVFLLSCAFMSVFSLKNSFYIASLSDQISDIDPGSTVTTTVFNVVFPLGGIASIPISAWLLGVNRARTLDDGTATPHRDDRTFALLVVLGVTHGVLNMAQSLGPQYAAIGVFAVLRSLKWSAFSDLVVKRWPLAHMGSLFGTSNAAISIANIAVYPLYAATRHGSVPSITIGSTSLGPFGFANGLLTLLEVACVVVPLYFWRQVVAARSQKKTGVL